MRQRTNVLFIGFTLALACNVSVAASSEILSKNVVSEKLSSLSVPFIKNTGQKNPSVLYYARTMGGAVFVNKQGELIYSLPKKTEKGIEGWAFKETFVGGQHAAKAIAGSDLKITYLTSENHVTAQTSTKLTLGQVAPGIELQLQASNNNVEKLFVVAAGADPANIKVKLDGVNQSHISKEGRLVLDTGLGPVEFTKPVAFQMQGDKKELVQVAYSLSDNQYGFTLGAYDKSREVVIDPLLASTFIGGVNNTGAVAYDYDRVYAVLSAGAYVYAGGFTQSPDFPTALGYDSSYNTLSEGFVLRFSSDLKTLVNGTFLGNAVYALAMNTDGTVIAAGQTNGGFPKTAGAYSYPSNYDQSGGFVAKLSIDLTSLIAGGVVVKAPSLTELAIGNGAIYFGGRTNNTSFDVTPGVVGPICNCVLYPGATGQAPSDGFIGRVSADLTTLEVLSYLSGENVSGIAVAADSSVYVTDGYYSGLGGSVRRLDADITAVLGSIDFGQVSSTNFYDVALNNGYVYVAGETRKSDLPSTSGAFDSTCGSDALCNTSYFDGFVAKLSANLDRVVALTYLGGSESDGVKALKIDDAGSVYVAGETRSANFPTSANAFDKTCGSDGKCDQTGPYGIKKEVFIAAFSHDLARLEYASFIGGSHDDFVNDIAVESAGIVFIGGETDWVGNFPTSNGAYDTSYNGGASDGYLSKFNTGGAGSGGTNAPPIANAGSDQTVAQNTKVTLNGGSSHDADGSIVAYHWSQLSGKVVSLTGANTPIASFIAPGVKKGRSVTLTFELTVTDDKGATDSDQVNVLVQ